MSDSGSKTLPVAVGASLAAAGLLVGLVGPKVVEKIILKMKPGGKFSGVSDFFHTGVPGIPGIYLSHQYKYTCMIRVGGDRSHRQPQNADRQQQTADCVGMSRRSGIPTRRSRYSGGRASITLQRVLVVDLVVCSVPGISDSFLQYEKTVAANTQQYCCGYLLVCLLAVSHFYFMLSPSFILFFSEVRGSPKMPPLVSGACLLLSTK